MTRQEKMKHNQAHSSSLEQKRINCGEITVMTCCKECIAACSCVS